MTQTINSSLSTPQATQASHYEYESAEEARSPAAQLVPTQAELKEARLISALKDLQIYNHPGMWLSDSARHRLDELTKSFARSQDIPYEEAYELVKGKVKKEAPELLLKNIPADLITAEYRWQNVMDIAARVKDTANLENMSYEEFRHIYFDRRLLGGSPE